MLGLAKRVGARSVFITRIYLAISWEKRSVLNWGSMLNCRILLTSTSEVYGDPLEHPQTEAYWGNVNPIGMAIHLLSVLYFMLPYLNLRPLILFCFLIYFLHQESGAATMRVSVSLRHWCLTTTGSMALVIIWHFLSFTLALSFLSFGKKIITSCH